MHPRRIGSLPPPPPLPPPSRYDEERSAEMGQQADQKRAAQLAIPGMVNPNDEGLMDDDL